MRSFFVRNLLCFELLLALYLMDVLCFENNRISLPGAFFTFPNHRLTSQPFKIHRVRSIINCAQFCLKYLHCVSTNFKPAKEDGNSFCELNEKGLLRPGDKQDLVESQGTVFSQYITLKTKGFDETKPEIKPAGFSFEFPSQSKSRAVVLRGIRNLDGITACFWMKSNDSQSKGTPISYAVQGQAEEFTIRNYNHFNLVIRGRRSVISLAANDGLWHHICVTWQSTDGKWRFYKDGFFAKDGTLKRGNSIRGGGVLVLGQEQDSLGGGFKTYQSFVGLITNVNIWDHVIPRSNITTMSNSCLSGEGNVVKWADFKGKQTIGVGVVEHSTCK